MIQRSKLYMDTVVEISIVSPERSDDIQKKIDNAFDAFRKVEDACSRFSPDSELMKACGCIEQPVAVSPYLFEPLKFAMAVAEWTGGIFDPVVGKRMEEHGFNRHYLTGQRIHSIADDSATYRDIILDERHRTLTLLKPLVIDLGAVAKGFAIDLAANELRPFDGFIVNAGGDLFAGGVNEHGAPWKIGIRHPVRTNEIIDRIEISNEAVCTSGSYERKSEKMKRMHHLIDPITIADRLDQLQRHCAIRDDGGRFFDGVFFARL